MSIHAAIWLDHQEAKVFHLDPESWNEAVLKKPKHHFSSHIGHGDAHRRGESHEQKEYFDSVAKAVSDAREVLVMGPGTAKLEFLRHVHENQPNLEPRIVGIETADHPTDGQIVAHTRKYFLAKDRMLGSRRSAIHRGDGTISAQDAEKLIAQGGVDVVDVREPHEWMTGHVAAARLVPLGKLTANPDGAKLGAKVLFVCERGGRSKRAAELAEARGIAEVYSLDGGTLAWRAANLPITVPEQPPADESASPELDAVVGENVKELRARRGYSLDVLAGLSGVGRQTLGRIELGRTVPSLGTLWKIAKAFEVPFSVLLARPGSMETRIFRSANAKRIADADGRFSSRALFSPDESGGVEFYELWIAGYGREDAEAHAPGTRENLIVTSGRLVLEIAKERYELGKGDAIAFSADVPHAYINPAAEECWMNLVMKYRAQ